MQLIAEQLQSLQTLLMFMMFIINILFAGGIAKDAGRLAKQGHDTWLVSGLVWAFATLIAGILVVLVYWFVHHANLQRK